MTGVEIALYVTKTNELNMRKQTKRETELKRMLKVSNVRVGKVYRSKKYGKTSKSTKREGNIQTIQSLRVNKLPSS